MNLFIDIETIPDQREGALENASELVKVPANYKKPEAIDKYKSEHAEETWLKTGLQGIAGEICSIAWALGDGEIIGNCRVSDTSEAWLLKHFFDCIEQEIQGGQGQYPSLTWIGHNVIDFDLRFIKQRALINNICPPFLIPADARHGSQSVFDTMVEWSGWKKYVKQDVLYKALGGQPYENDDMDGSMVWSAYQNGEYEKIRLYNIRDVEKCRFIYNRMTWKN